MGNSKNSLLCSLCLTLQGSSIKRTEATARPSRDSTNQAGPTPPYSGLFMLQNSASANHAAIAQSPCPAPKWWVYIVYRETWSMLPASQIQQFNPPFFNMYPVLHPHPISTSWVPRWWMGRRSLRGEVEIWYTCTLKRARARASCVGRHGLRHTLLIVHRTKASTGIKTRFQALWLPCFGDLMRVGRGRFTSPVAPQCCILT